MTKRNIALMSILLIILLIIIGINLAIAQAKQLEVSSLGVKTVSVTSASRLDRLGVLGNGGLVADSKMMDALMDGVLNVNAEELLVTSSNLLNF